MMFIGFGFLMVFLKRYGYSAVGFNFFLASFALQLNILIQEFWVMVFKGTFHQIPLSVKALIDGDYCAAAILITFGGLLGKTNLR